MSAMSFYEATNEAQETVAMSLTDPTGDWAAIATARGATLEESGAYRFPDGSAITLICGGLPVEYIGG